MRILHIDETFHPAYGYQCNPLARFQQLQGNEVFIAAPTRAFMYPVYREFGDDGSALDAQDAAYEAETGVKILRVPAKGYVLNRLNYGGAIFKTVDAVKPDALFVHCVETLTAMKFLLKRPKYPMMFDSHMLSMASRNRFARLYEAVYRRSFAAIIRKNGYYVVRTQDDDYVNSRLGIPEALTPFISFGTDTVRFCPSEAAREAFRKAHGIGQSDFVVVYTGKLTEAKGGLLLAEAFSAPFEVSVTLVCVGTPPADAYGREVRARLEASPNRVLMFPTQSYAALPPFYQMADLCVFARQCSLSFYDAQACGLPVVSEDNNVNRERCGHGNGGNFHPGDVQAFRAEIMRFARMDAAQLRAYRRNARAFIEAGYDYADIARRYTACLEDSVARQRARRGLAHGTAH